MKIIPWIKRCFMFKENEEKYWRGEAAMWRSECLKVVDKNKRLQKKVDFLQAELGVLLSCDFSKKKRKKK